MTTQHAIGYYLDNHVSIAYCKVCSAEGEKLLEDCPQKVINPQNISTKGLDEKNQTAK